MAAEPKDMLAELRKPFDPKAVGKLPKAGIQLDYVGHANVTDRLLNVDPTWTWEPVAYDERGLPQYDNAGGLWIRLTVGGVTRLGYGDGPDPKQRIGDALRNAAMRFGVALDLWSKDELESNIENPENKNIKPSEGASAPYKPKDAPHVSETTVPALSQTISPDQVADLLHIAKLKGYTTKEAAVKFLNETTGFSDFTIMHADDFELYKRKANGRFAKPGSAEPF